MAWTLPESGTMTAVEISVAVGYEDHSYFRRLFKRLTGLAPGQYRRMFQSVINAADESPERQH